LAALTFGAALVRLVLATELRHQVVGQPLKALARFDDVDDARDERLLRCAVRGAVLLELLDGPRPKGRPARALSSLHGMA
jgi:hypothetical protein